MPLLTAKDYRRMPWRNGGGTTTEITRAPADGKEGERFVYRVSIADVTRDGPFSRFDGYDRHIMLLEGRGMTLECGAHGRLALTEPFVPRSFSGDWDVHGALVAGAVRDFNLMVDRARATSSLEVHALAAPVDLAAAADGVAIVHLLAGSLEGAEAGDTIVADAPLRLVPRGLARIAVARVILRRD
jgi:environmental stress-induced protein Ves